MQTCKVRTVRLDNFFENARIDIERKLKDSVEEYGEGEKLGYLLSHGKRLRPLLSMLVFRSCGGDERSYQSVLDLAVAIELQHSASLVHDDIIDGDDKRRSKLSYYRVFGIEDAVLMGHKAIVLGFKKVLGHDPKILETFFDVWERSLKGEAEEVASRKSSLALLTCDEARYFGVIMNKTASLFAGAAKIGSQMAAVQEDLQNLFWNYGKYIGMAYQLADDKLDLEHGNMDLLSISWIARNLDRKSLEFLSDSLRDGLCPSITLSKLNVDVEGMFSQEIAKMQSSAENLARSNMIPKNKFSPMLLEAPSYIVNGCLKGK